MISRRQILSLVGLMLAGLSHPRNAWAKRKTNRLGAFELGGYLTTALVGRARGLDFKHFHEQSEAIAQELGVKLPPFPAKGSDQEADLHRALQYLLVDSKKVAAKLPKEEALAFETGVKLHVLRATYSPGQDSGLSTVLASRTKSLGLPANLCQKLQSQVSAKAENPEIQQELTTIYQAVRKHLKKDAK